MDRSRLPRPNFRRILDKADVDGSGELDRRTLTDAVKDSGVDLSRKVIKQIFELLDVDYAGRVRISDFLRFVDDSIGEDLRAEDEHIDEEMRELRQQVQRAVDAGIDIIECFEHFDTDTSGTIDEDEFYRGLQKLDMDVSRSEARKMMDKFPGRRRGQIKFREFIKAMRLERREEVDTRGLQEDIRREIRRLAETRYGRPRFRQVFEEIDRDGSGTIDRREFKKAMEQIGFELSSRQVKQLFTKFDRYFTGEITYKDFEKFAEDGDGDVRSSRDRDYRSSSRYDDRYSGSRSPSRRSPRSRGVRYSDSSYN